jgi:ketosteroid isomerase-like protein
VDHEKQPGPARNSPANQPDEELTHDAAVDEFFARLNNDMRHPKPGQESIAAALQAIQRLAVEADSEEPVNAPQEAQPATTRACHGCGHQNPGENKFCAICGVPLDESVPEQPETPAAKTSVIPVQHPAGQHHYHHHYHHHYFQSADGVQAPGSDLRPADMRSANPGAAARVASRVRGPLGAPSLSRAEVAVRKLTQDWALACNTKHLDDLVELYVADALVLRPNVPAVRGTAAIREFFFAALDSGLGEVELEPLRVEVLGEVAYEAGRCKMLVPVAMGKRREERGKYMVILSRQGGDWKIISDCWSSDLSLGVGVEPGARPGPQNPGNPLARPPRKNA